jgi:transposase-like protein
VSEKPTRRKFTAEYKQRILQEATKCKPGELGALPRREGLYSSHLATWREQERKALSPQKRGRKAEEPNQLSDRVTDLEKQNAELQKRLAQAEAIIEVQKKSQRSWE